MGLTVGEQMNWRREGLGRNRQVGRPSNTMGALFVLMLMMGAWAYSYFERANDPVRIFGAKVLNCPPRDLSVRPKGEELVIEGCGRVLYARCDESGCIDVDAFE